MNAMMLEIDAEETADMQLGENNNLAIQVAELRSDVRHIQSDVTDIKAEIRITNQRFDLFKKETGERFEKIDQKFDSLRDSLKEEFGEIKDSLASAKIWALGLYIALAGSLLYALARGVKWI